MMRAFVLAACLGLSTLLTAQTAKRTPAVTTAVWTKNTAVEFVFSQPDSATFAPLQKPGKSWFFEYKHVAAQNPDMTDDEFVESICFEMPPTTKSSFRFTGEQLMKQHAYYMLGCFCKDRGFHPIDRGTISGKKVSASTWLVTVDVTIETGSGNVRKKITRNFRLKAK